MKKETIIENLIKTEDFGFHASLSFNCIDYGSTINEGKFGTIVVPKIIFSKGSHEDVLKYVVKKKLIELPEGWKRIKKNELKKYESLGLVADTIQNKAIYYYEDYKYLNKYFDSFIEWSNKYCRMDIIWEIYDNYKNKEEE